MTIDQVINVLATVTLFEMMLAIGLGVTPADIIAVGRNWSIVCRALLANYVLVPLIAAGLLLFFHPAPAVAAGLLVVAVCPGAPFGPPFTALARGNVPTAVGLMVLLAASSALIAPLLLALLLPITSGGGGALKIDAIKMVSTLALSQFLPLCCGIFIRKKNPVLADKIRKPFDRLSAILNLLLLGIILAVQFPLLVQIRVAAWLGMIALVFGAFISGWLIGGPGRENGKIMAITTAVRNVGVGFVIVAGSFPGTAAITAATTYALLQTCLMALVALAWGRLESQKTNVLARAGL